MVQRVVCLAAVGIVVVISAAAEVVDALIYERLLARREARS